VRKNKSGAKVFFGVAILALISTSAGAAPNDHEQKSLAQVVEARARFDFNKLCDASSISEFFTDYLKSIKKSDSQRALNAFVKYIEDSGLVAKARFLKPSIRAENKKKASFVRKADQDSFSIRIADGTEVRMLVGNSPPAAIKEITLYLPDAASKKICVGLLPAPLGKKQKN